MTSRRTILRTMTALAVTVATLLSPSVPPSNAVVIRGDRGDDDALRLAAPFNAVGQVLPDGVCTLIAPTWAITAAHVAASIPEGGQVAFADRKYDVKRTIIHPQGTAREGVPPEVDLALIELDQPVADIMPITLYAGDSELGRELVIVGYGDYGTAGDTLRHSDGERRAVTNLVDDAGPVRLFMKFDAPPAGTQDEGVGGPGDSGGPALLEEKGAYYVAGISSASMNGKPGHYGVTDVYTRVSTQLKWIGQAMSGE